MAWPVTFGMGDMANAYFTMLNDGGTGEHSFNVSSGWFESFKVNGVEKGRFNDNGFLLPPGTTANAPLNITQGVAPSNPVNGDIWTTQSGVFAQINGATIPLGVIGDLEKSTSPPTTKIVTVNSAPIIVKTISIAPGENIIVEATASAILSNGNGSYHSKKARGFLKNSAGVLSEDSTITDLMPDKYRGSGLSSPTFTIKSDGDEIIIEAIGEDNDNLSWSFSFVILRNQVTL